MAEFQQASIGPFTLDRAYQGIILAGTVLAPSDEERLDVCDEGLNGKINQFLIMFLLFKERPQSQFESLVGLRSFGVGCSVDTVESAVECVLV